MRLAGYLAAIAALAPALGAQGNLAIPKLGAVYDPSVKTVRGIVGLPGAAVFGPSWNTGAPLDGAAISPRHDAAIGFRTARGRVRWTLLRETAEANSISGIADPRTTVVFAPGGNSAALVGNRIRLVSDLAGSPSVREIGTPAATGDWAAAAVSDDGRVVLSAGGDPAGPVWVTGEAATQLPLPGTVIAAAFRAGASDAVAATRSGDIYWIGDAGPNARVRLLYAGDGRTADPVAVYVSADGANVYTATRAGVLAVISVATGSVSAEVSCGCTPSTLAPLSGNALFRITDMSENLLLILDVSGAKPRVWFVPRPAAVERSER